MRRILERFSEAFRPLLFRVIGPEDLGRRRYSRTGFASRTINARPSSGFSQNDIDDPKPNAVRIVQATKWVWRKSETKFFGIPSEQKPARLRLFDHPVERAIGQSCSVVTATDVAMRAGKPDLLEQPSVGAVLLFPKCVGTNVLRRS